MGTSCKMLKRFYNQLFGNSGTRRKSQQVSSNNTTRKKVPSNEVHEELRPAESVAESVAKSVSSSDKGKTKNTRKKHVYEILKSRTLERGTSGNIRLFQNLDRILNDENDEKHKRMLDLIKKEYPSAKQIENEIVDKGKNKLESLKIILNPYVNINNRTYKKSSIKPKLEKISENSRSKSN